MTESCEFITSVFLIDFLFSSCKDTLHNIEPKDTEKHRRPAAVCV